MCLPLSIVYLNLYFGIRSGFIVGITNMHEDVCMFAPVRNLFILDVKCVYKLFDYVVYVRSDVVSNVFFTPACSQTASEEKLHVLFSNSVFLVYVAN